MKIKYAIEEEKEFDDSFGPDEIEAYINFLARGRNFVWCKENENLFDKQENFSVKQNIECPFCKKPLVKMSETIESPYIVLLATCPKCANGTDVDWQITFNETTKGLVDIKRHFWG